MFIRPSGILLFVCAILSCLQVIQCDLPLFFLNCHLGLRDGIPKVIPTGFQKSLFYVSCNVGDNNQAGTKLIKLLRHPYIAQKLHSKTALDLRKAVHKELRHTAIAVHDLVKHVLKSIDIFEAKHDIPDWDFIERLVRETFATSPLAKKASLKISRRNKRSLPEPEIMDANPNEQWNSEVMEALAKVRELTPDELRDMLNNGKRPNTISQEDFKIVLDALGVATPGKVYNTLEEKKEAERRLLILKAILLGYGPNQITGLQPENPVQPIVTTTSRPLTVVVRPRPIVVLPIARPFADLSLKEHMRSDFRIIDNILKRAYYFVRRNVD